MPLNIQRLNFDPVTGDNPSEAFMKLDIDIGELADAIGSTGEGVGSLDERVTAVEDVVEGLGDSSTRNVGTAAGTVAAGDDDRFLRIGLKNKLINGTFDFFQRGGNVTYSNNFGAGNSSGYGADRWVSQTYGGSSSTGTAACTVARQTFALGQTDVAGEPTYFARLNAPSVPVPAGNSACIRCSQAVEDVRTVTGAHTFSVWLKADSARTIGVTLYQNFGNGGSSYVIAFQAKQAVTTSWARYNFTFTPVSMAGKTIGTNSSFVVMLWLYAQDNALLPGMTIGPFGAMSTAAFLDMACAQLECGSLATNVEQRPKGLELALCQRYYEKSYRIEVAPGTVTGDGLIGTFVTAGLPSGTYSTGMTTSFKVTKRGTPAVTLYGSITGTPGKVSDLQGGTEVSGTVFAPTDANFTWVATNSSARTSYNLQCHYAADAEL